MIIVTLGISSNPINFKKIDDYFSLNAYAFLTKTGAYQFFPLQCPATLKQLFEIAFLPKGYLQAVLN